MIKLKHFDDFLSEVLDKYGLGHGYENHSNGAYVGHWIFEKGSLKKLSELGKLFSGGKSYYANNIAVFEEEPWYNSSIGCVNHKTPRLHILDNKYYNQIYEVFKKIKEYTESRRKDNVLILPRENSSLVLGVI